MHSLLNITLNSIATVALITTTLFAQAPGTFDTSFGNSGTIFHINTRNWNMAIQADLKILVLGENQVSTTTNWTVRRFNTDGTLDTGFANQGEAIVPGSGFQSNRDIAVDSQGRILVVGHYLTQGRKSQPALACARLLPTGAMDTSFGSNGVAVHKIGKSTEARGVLIDSSTGKILVSGVMNDGSAVKGTPIFFAFVARLDSTGALDTASFGTAASSKKGKKGGGEPTFTGFGITEELGFAKRTVNSILLADGRIAIANVHFNSRVDQAAVVTVFTSTGQLDSNFGAQGAVTWPTGTTVYLTPQNDGRLVCGINGGTSGISGVSRLNTDGSLDMSFGTGGTTAMASNGDLAIFTTTVQADGKIVAGGYTRSWDSNQIPVYEMLTLRLNTDGSFDTGFGTNGFAESLTSPATGIQHLRATPDGKIIAFGYSLFAGATIQDTMLARYWQ